MTTIAESVAETYASAEQTHRDSVNAVAVALDPQASLNYGKNLKGKVVIITGAGSGFGRSYARVAAKFGAKVVLSDLALGPVEALAKEIQAEGGIATAIQCDTTNWDQQVAMFKHGVATFGPIDVVFPNAGVTETGNWLEDSVTANGDPAKPNFLTMNVNLIGASYTTKLAFYYLRRNPSKGHKAIVLMGSMSSFTGIPAAGVYTMTKHGMLGLFRSVYYNAQVEGINLNIVCPWFTDTGILDGLTRLAIFGLPLTEIEDVVTAVVRSSSDPSFTGNSISVDATGILAIPFEAYGVGEKGYYHEFGRRAIFSITVEKVVKDAIRLVKYSIKTKLGKGAVLGLIFAVLRHRKTRAP